MKMTIKIKQIGACAVLAALMMAGAWLNTACSSDETIVDNKPAVGVNTTPTETTVKFTATLAPKGDNASGTRAITTGTDGGKEILNVKWKIDEKIAIYYQKTDDSYAMAKATVGEPNTDGSAPITATLTNAKGGTATFIYPYSLATKDGKINTSIESDFRKQDGTIDFISTYLDAATTTGTIDVSGGTATISGRIKMENQVCICKLDFDLIVDPNDGANYYNVFVDVKKTELLIALLLTTSLRPQWVQCIWPSSVLLELNVSLEYMETTITHQPLPGRVITRKNILMSLLRPGSSIEACL